MTKMRTATFVISILAGILVLSAVVALARNSTVDSAAEVKSESTGKTLSSHAPIYIDGNADFADADDDGVSNPSASGTESDPYIIENWDINASSADGIEIRNTTVYSVIRNCTIHEGKYNYSFGIYFYNVTNGKIDNATSYNNYYGICFSFSSNNSIVSCAIYNNHYGIDIFSSSNNTITNCALYNNYYLGYPYSSFSYSIRIGLSNNNQITNCAVYNNIDYGIYLDCSSNNNITNCAVYNNKNGIYMYSSVVGAATGSLDNQITNCTIYNNDKGIYIDGSSANIQITSCDIYNNSYGVYLWCSSNNDIHYCNIYNNTNYGVYSTVNVNATHNWWGSASGPYHPSTNLNGTGDSVSDNVLYNPWLTELLDFIPPKITNIQNNPSVQKSRGYVNITCTVMDNVDVDKVYVNITGSAGFTPITITMTRIADTDNYYYNTTYSIAGEYSYYIWTIDASANENKSIEYHFTIMPTFTTTVAGKELNITGAWIGTINVIQAALPQTQPKNWQYIIFICINVTITGTFTYANITIKYNGSDVVGIDKSNLRMYYWNETENKWKICEKTGVDVDKNIVWANITHLTIFALMAEKVSEVQPLNWLLYIGIFAVVVIIVVAVVVIARLRKKQQ